MSLPRPLVAVLLLAAPAAAQAAHPAPAVPPLPASQAEVRFDSSGLAGTRLVNRTYHHVTLPGSTGGARELLLLQETDVAVRRDREGAAGTVRVRALAPQGRRFTRPVWTVAADGSEVRTDFDRFLRVTLPGCCTALSTHGWYALADGRAVTSFTTEPLLLPGRAVDDDAFAVFHSSWGAAPPPELRPEDEVLGVLRLVAGGRVSDRVVLAGDSGLGGDVRLSLEHSPGRDGTPGPWVVLRFGGSDTLRIPVRGGRFDVHAAELPEGVALERRTR